MTMTPTESHQPPPSRAQPAAFSWDAWRRKLIDGLFRRIFRRVGGGLCEPGQLPIHGIHRVLVCRPNHRLGNTVLLSPLVQEIETLYPGAEIDILACEAADALFGRRFRVRRIFAVPHRVAHHLLHTIGLLRELRRSRYDLAIDACHGSQSGRLMLALTRSRYKLGFPSKTTSPDSGWHACDWPPHHAQRNVFLLRRARSGGTIASDYPMLDVGVNSEEAKEASRVVAILSQEASAKGQRVVGIFTNATGAKRYDESWWVQFLTAFREAHPDVCIVDFVAAHGCSHLDGNIASFYSRNLRRMASFIANLDAFISADCGVMHLAVASGTPTLGLFRTTDPAKYAPYGGHNTGFVTEGMDARQVAAIASRWLDHAVPDIAAAPSARSATSPYS